jgi:hypothetical protein
VRNASFRNVSAHPGWPVFIAFLYISSPSTTPSFIGRSNQDIFVTAALPVRKRDVVRARVYTIAVFAHAADYRCSPVRMIKQCGLHPSQHGGMNTNFAFFGSCLLYAIFNVIFLPGFYKTVTRSAADPFRQSLTAACLRRGRQSCGLSGSDMKGKPQRAGADRLTSQLPVLGARNRRLCAGHAARLQDIRKSL